MMACTEDAAEPAPRFVVFAGINGAGKSTLYRSGLWAESQDDLKLPRVNPDEIIRAKGWDWSSRADQLRAGKIALAQIRDHLLARESFNQETTLAGHLTVAKIKQAAASGYEIHMAYVGVETLDIALARISHRVDLGGHDIDEAHVKRRCKTSIANLLSVAPFCTTIRIFDNTDRLKLVAYVVNGRITVLHDEFSGMHWFSDVIEGLSDNT